MQNINIFDVKILRYGCPIVAKCFREIVDLATSVNSSLVVNIFVSVAHYDNEF